LSSAHAAPKTASAPSAAASATRRSAGSDQRSCVVLTRDGNLFGNGRVLGGQDDERDEGKEPREVEVEPVCQHQLEADQQRGRQRG